MDQQELHVFDLDNKPTKDYRSNVDSSRPFRSVKEAVEIFGERILVVDIYSPKPFTLPQKEVPLFAPSPRERSFKSSSENSCIDRIYEKFTNEHGSNYGDETTLSDMIKKFEAELEETKAELKLLKEKEAETGVALATLNAELHKNMSKLAMAEADAAGKAVSASRTTPVRGEITRVEEKKREEFLWSKSTSLAEILRLGDKEGLFVEKKLKDRKVVMKKKPLIPLVADLFSKKKGPSGSRHSALHASPLQWN